MREEGRDKDGRDGEEEMKGGGQREAQSGRGDTERLERWKSDKGRRSEIKEQEVGEAARGGRRRAGKVCCFCRCKLLE